MDSSELNRWQAVFAGWIDEAGAGDAAHDPAHVRRVVANAVRLGQTEAAAAEVVLPAAWLHDCVLVPKSSPERKRASQLAAVEAVRKLRGADYPAEFLPGIAHAIAAHSFSAGIAPETLEAKIVQDADRLDALGAIGIARCLALGGAMNRPLYAETDPFCDNRPADDGRFSLDHFPAKLLRLESTMQTAAGRHEAHRRTEFIRGYLAELRLEIETGGINEPRSTRKFMKLIGTEGV
jgi:uncharacterized protein